MPDIELHQADTLSAASALLSQHAPDVRMLAGGTDVLVDLKTERIRVGHLVSLNRIDELRGITTDDTGLRIGALTTIAQLNRDPVVKQRFAPLRDAAGKMAAPPIRSAATVGGNIASAVPCADMPTILIAMRASVALWSTQGQRTVSLSEFFVGPRETVCRDDEIILAILVPTMKPGFGAAYARFGLREGNSIAVASVAAGLALNGDDSIEDARIVLGAVAPVPLQVNDAGTSLAGQPAGESSFRTAARIAKNAAQPICDVRGSADYRRDLVEVLTQRALTTALNRAKESRS